MKTPFTDLIKFPKKKSVMTYYGKTHSGEEFFAYVECDPQNARKMYNDFANSTPRYPHEYGTLIYRDSLSEPNENAKAFLENYLANNK